MIKDKKDRYEIRITVSIKDTLNDDDEESKMLFTIKEESESKEATFIKAISDMTIMSVDQNLWHLNNRPEQP